MGTGSTDTSETSSTADDDGVAALVVEMAVMGMSISPEALLFFTFGFGLVNQFVRFLPIFFAGVFAGVFSVFFAGVVQSLNESTS